MQHLQDVLHAVQTLGQHLGRTDLSLGKDGTLRVRLAKGDEIGLELLEDRLLVSRTYPVGFIQAGQLLDALQAANARAHDTAWPIQVGLQGRGADCRLLVATTIGAQQVESSRILQALASLQDWFTQCARGWR